MCRLVDPIVETWNDLMTAQFKALSWPLETDREMVISAFTNGDCVRFYGLCENNFDFHGGKFIAGDKVTIADFVLASYVANVLIN